MLLAELESRAGLDPILERLLRHEVRPTADAYIAMNWWGELPPEIDNEEQEIIDLLNALEAEGKQ
jgi:hypothetical protein